MIRADKEFNGVTLYIHLRDVFRDANRSATNSMEEVLQRLQELDRLKEEVLV